MRTLSDIRGFSLVEAIIVIGVLGLVATGMASLVANMTKSTKTVEQKLELMQLKSDIEIRLKDPAVCTPQLANGTNQIVTADVTSTNPSPTEISFTQINASAGASPAVLAKVGEVFGTSVTRMAVQSITLRNILATGSLNEYSGTLEIAMDPATTSMPFRPVTNQLSFKTDAAGVILACSGGQGIEGGVTGTETCATAVGGTNPFSTVSCPYSFAAYGDFTNISFENTCASADDNGTAAAALLLLDSAGATIYNMKLCSTQGVSNSQTSTISSSMTFPRWKNATGMRIELVKPARGHAEIKLRFLK